MSPACQMADTAHSAEIEPSGFNAGLRLRGSWQAGCLIVVGGANQDGSPAMSAAEYRSSEVMTFIVTPDDAVHQKDLGPDTANLAQKVTAVTPSSSSSWHAAE